MASAIRDLQKAELSLAKELEVEKQTLMSKAQPPKVTPASRPAVPQPAKSPAQNQGKVYTDAEKIQLYQKSNPKKTKAEIEQYLRSIKEIN
jgi:hypothetical protein